MASAAPRNDQAKPDSPWRSLQGEKWSDDIPPSKPAVLGALREAQQATGRDLLVRAVERDEGHASFLPMAARESRGGLVDTTEVPSDASCPITSSRTIDTWDAPGLSGRIGALSGSVVSALSRRQPQGTDQRGQGDARLGIT